MIQSLLLELAEAQNVFHVVMVELSQQEVGIERIFGIGRVFCCICIVDEKLLMVVD
jgi:hypothetical protein